MTIEQNVPGSAKAEIERQEKDRLLGELGMQFADFKRSAQIDVVETLKTIGRMINDESVSFRNAVGEIRLDEMEKGEVMNTPAIPSGATQSIELLLNRDNEKVGNVLTFSEALKYLEKEIAK